MKTKIAIFALFILIISVNNPLNAETVCVKGFTRANLSLNHEKCTKARFPDIKISNLNIIQDTLIKTSPLLEKKPVKADKDIKKRSLLITLANKFLYTPYRWGGTGPGGFDCTGFVYFLYKSIGIPIPRTIESMYQKGSQVGKQNLSPGDILYFVNTFRRGLSHVGVYLGGNKFIHASSHGRGVRIDSIDSSYFIRRFFSAKQIIK